MKKYWIILFMLGWLQASAQMREGYIRSFDITRNNAMVQMAWETISNDSRGFDVQRRMNGGEWITIAYVASVVPSGAGYVNYLYGDLNKVACLTEYRLKQEDATGRTFYSQIQTVRGMNDEGWVVYPNPSHDGRLNIQFENIHELRDIQIVDQNGKIWRQWRSINAEGQQVNDLYPGNYIVRVINQLSGEILTRQVIVKR